MTRTNRRGVRGMIPNNLKTDETLIRKLEESAKLPLTKEEARAQRVSFVYGNMPQDSSVSRNEIANIIARIEGEAT